MAAELIHVDQKSHRITMNPVVSQFATSLSPFAAAASIASSAANVVANIAACSIEIGRFKQESKRLTKQHAIASDIIRMRQYTIVQFFEYEQRTSLEARLNREDARLILRSATTVFSDINAAKYHHRLAQEVMLRMSGDFLKSHISDGNTLIRLSDSFRLGDIETAVAAWRAIQA